MSEHVPEKDAWRYAMREDAAEVSARLRFGPALMLVGWVHLAAFAACQALVDPRIRSDPRHLALWVADVVGSLSAIRLVCGRGWFRASPAAGLIARTWGTFLILAFNLSMMNGLGGWDHDWFKPPWGTLGTFGFATMAWLFDLRFLTLAVLMYATGLAMIALPGWNYLIYGVSWWAALQLLGGFLAVRASRRAG